MKEEFVNKIKIDDLIEYELENHECYYTGDYIEVISIVSDYYKNLDYDTVWTKVQEIYNKNKEKNLLDVDNSNIGI